jgi:hypothetical protein
MFGPELGRELLRWVIFVVALSGVALLVLDPGTPSFVISVVTFGLGVLCGGVLLVVIRRRGR